MIKKDYPNTWTDLIGEVSCGVGWVNKKTLKFISMDTGKCEGKWKNNMYVPLSKRKKGCNKHLGLDCIGCPFALISDATPEMIKHVEKFYKKR